MQDMKRIGIFVFYDPNGIFDGYIEYLLDSLKPYIQKLVIVVNEPILAESLAILKNFSEYIFVRKNVGYDGGAYKDAILGYLKDEKWQLWDELILMNDTFYGPLYSWSEIFDKMDREKVDFWGLSKHLGGTINSINGGKPFPSHIQSYFIACRKPLFLNLCFSDFWKALKYTKTHSECVENFEINFSYFFQNKGFISKSYIDIANPNFQLRYNEIVYMDRAFELLQEVRFPVVKRTALSFLQWDKMKEILAYVKENTNYDIELIMENWERRNGLYFGALENFYNMHRRIYIYGYGVYGKALARYFISKEWKFESYIVTENDDTMQEVKNFRDIEFDIQDGVILALGKKNLEEVYPIVKRCLFDSQIFCLLR